MRVYLVGGAVRDGILGREVHDRDYVVVGATHEEMINKGFTKVGAAFPVYLHPETKEEYALARTERRTGEGHTGFETFFSPDVTLEEDLSRRDLTINAMAQDIETGEIIDPFNGQKDIHHKVLRHTTEAFMDDPLRILRLFRFQSQLGGDWEIAQETFDLVMDNYHRLSEISPERKWKEMEKTLHTPNFHCYVSWMAKLGQLPELEALKGVQQPPEHHPEGDAFVHTMLCLAYADKEQVSSVVKFSVLCHDFGKAVTFVENGNLHGHELAGVPVVEAFCERLRVPNVYRDNAKYVTENHTRVHSLLGRDDSKPGKPNSVMRLFEKSGNIRLPESQERIHNLISACICDAKGRGPRFEKQPYLQAELAKAYLSAACSVEEAPIARKVLSSGKSGLCVKEAIRVARIDAIRSVKNEFIKERGKC